MSDIQFAKIRFGIANAIVANVRRGALNMFNLQLKPIVREHHRLTGTVAYSSNNMGYHADPFMTFTLGNRPKMLTLAALPASLEGQHAEWLHGYQEFEHMGQRLSQQLLSLLGKAQSYQDLRDMLPDIAYRAFPNEHPINLLTRSRPDLHACQLEDPRHWDPKMVCSYAGISSLVDTYIGYSLL